MSALQSPVTLPVADCSLCPFRSKTLLTGRCMPGDTCVLADSGRQVDRFFRVNPAYADHYLNDRFWERRAIAVRYASPRAGHQRGNHQYPEKEHPPAGRHRRQERQHPQTRFDRQAGYPFAWFFYMLKGQLVPAQTGVAVFQDISGDFAYLPARDAAVLQDWMEMPYNVYPGTTLHDF